MRHVIRWSLLLASSIAMAGPEYGAVSFVNATCLAQRIEVSVDGEPLSAHGYAHGDFSGGLLFSTSRAIEITATAVAVAPMRPLRLTPCAGTSQLVVFYAVKEPPGSNPGFTLKAHVLLHREPTARRSITAVYLGREPLVVVRVNDRDIRLATGDPSEIWGGNGSSCAVAMPWGVARLSLDEPGHYWLVLSDPVGRLTNHVLIPDLRYSVPTFDAEGTQ